MIDPPRRGRPRDESKRDAILAAARTLFLTDGVDAVPLDTVIAAAKVSKTTFYSSFADCGVLLEAVIRRETLRVIADVPAPVGENLVEALTAFGDRLLALLTDPDIIGFERLVAAAARAHPDLPDRFYQAGPGRSRAALAALIVRAHDAGLVRVEDANDAAADLVGLWQGMVRVEMSMGGQVSPDAPARRARAERGVTLFLRAYRP